MQKRLLILTRKIGPDCEQVISLKLDMFAASILTRYD